MSLPFAAIPTALAAAGPTARFEARPIAGHPVADLRMGVVRSDPTGHPYVCAEGRPLAWLGIEGCGTGSGFLFPADGPDMAHFRARVVPIRRAAARFDGEVAAGVGIAEIDVAPDDPGFKFGEADPSEERPVEAAGPEAALAVRGRCWIDPRAYLVVDVTAGAAHLPAAPVVLGAGGTVLPFAALTVGVGF